MAHDNETLIRRLICGEAGAVTAVIDRAATTDCPALLVAAALVSDVPGPLLARAERHATTTRDRQLLAIATAHVAREEDLLDALVRDHLSDHPDNLLVAWIAAQHTHVDLRATSPHQE
jgi:hypothetical protein